MEIILALKIDPYHYIYVEQLTSELVDKFNSLFPDIEPTNKLHHMLHYVELMKIVGPPIRYWCMRFESFHNIAKKRAQAKCNFINISKSVADHIQTKFCSNLLKGVEHKPDIIMMGYSET